MCRPHVVAANRRSAGPAARYPAYLPSASFSWSREPNRLDSVHGQELRPFLQHPRVALPRARRRAAARRAAPAATGSRPTAGRGAPGPSSNSRSSSTSTGIRSGISGRFAMSQDSQPRDEKKLRITNRNDRNTTRPAAAGNHSSRGAPELIATR